MLAPSYAVARGDFDVERWFSLEQGGPLRLRVSRQGWFGKTELSVDRVPLGSFDVKELRQGQTLPLPDGTLLYVQLKRSFGDAWKSAIAQNVPTLPIPTTFIAKST